MRVANLNLGGGEWLKVATSQANSFASRKGFGLLEVLVAAVVLGFLIIGLNNLQKGNRESILRVRARDAANAIAQEVIDSLAALGPASVQANSNGYSLDKKRVFDGEAGKVEMLYSINFIVTDATTSQAAEEKTDYMKALETSGNPDNFSVKHQFAKQVEVTVNWNFKNNSKQSINMSSVIR
jgi:Tfp pilus assembly protein PilV